MFDAWVRWLFGEDDVAQAENSERTLGCILRPTVIARDKRFTRGKHWNDETAPVLCAKIASITRRYAILWWKEISRLVKFAETGKKELFRIPISL